MLIFSVLVMSTIGLLELFWLCILALFQIYLHLTVPQGKGVDQMSECHYRTVKSTEILAERLNLTSEYCWW